MQFLRKTLIFTAILGLALSSSMSAYFCGASLWAHKKSGRKIIFIHNYDCWPKTRGETESASKQVPELTFFLRSTGSNYDAVFQNKFALENVFQQNHNCYFWHQINSVHSSLFQARNNQVTNLEFRQEQLTNPHSECGPVFESFDEKLFEIQKNIDKYPVLKKYYEYFQKTILTPLRPFIDALSDNHNKEIPIKPICGYRISSGEYNEYRSSVTNEFGPDMAKHFKKNYLARRHLRNEKDFTEPLEKLALYWNEELLSILMLAHICKTKKDICFVTDVNHARDLEDHFELGSLLEQLGFEKVIHTNEDYNLKEIVDIEEFEQQCSKALKQKKRKHEQGNTKTFVLSGLALGLIGFSLYKWLWSK